MFQATVWTFIKLILHHYKHTHPYNLKEALYPPMAGVQTLLVMDRSSTKIPTYITVSEPDSYKMQDLTKLINENLQTLPLWNTSKCEDNAPYQITNAWAKNQSARKIWHKNVSEAMIGAYDTSCILLVKIAALYLIFSVLLLSATSNIHPVLFLTLASNIQLIMALLMFNAFPVVCLCPPNSIPLWT